MSIEEENSVKYSGILLKNLHYWCFGAGGSAAAVPPEVLCLYGFGAWPWYFDGNVLSGQSRVQAEHLYQEQNVIDFRQEVAFRKICSAFAADGIRFCPLKGADLAWRIYPDGALRAKRDLDILVHPDDIRQSLAMLKKSGWTVPYQIAHFNHHPMMTQHGVALDVHHRLPMFKAGQMREIWDILQPGDGTSMFLLPPELNFLVLFNHCREHRWNCGIRLLADFVFLVRHSGLPDFEKLNALAARFDVASPELMFAAFPEFFPGCPPLRNIPAASLPVFRELILNGIDMKMHSVAIAMSSGNRFSLPWLRRYIHALAPGSVRLKTANPSGNYFRLLCGYMTMFKRVWALRKGAADELLRSHMAHVEYIENILKDAGRS